MLQLSTNYHVYECGFSISYGVYIITFIFPLSVFNIKLLEWLPFIYY